MPHHSTHVTSRHIPALDGVRGVAILVVVVHNASWILEGSDRFVPKLLVAATASGWVGVQLFFVLSGFLITGILMDTRRSEAYFRSFYVRRVLRIFPLYYVFLAVAFGVVPFLADPAWSEVARARQGWYWAYMSNWHDPLGGSIPGLPHFWSLAVEEQFYLVWPFLVYALDRRRLVTLCVAAVALTPLIRWGLNLSGLPSGAGYEFTIARWDALAAGALLALVMFEESGQTWLASRMGLVGGFGLIALGVFLALDHGFHEGDPAVQILGQSITLLLFGWLVWAAVSNTSGPARSARDVLSIGWLRLLGKYSYAMYVFHYPIHAVASHYLSDVVNGADTTWRVLRWAAYVGGVGALSLVLAIASWYVLEKRFLDLKDRLAPRPVRARAAQEA